MKMPSTLKTSFYTLIVCLSFTIAAQAESYEFGSDTHTAVLNNGYNSGNWTDWANCKRVIGVDAAPRGLHAYFLDANAHYAKIRLACREIEADGTFASTYTLSDDFFTYSEPGSYDNTQTDSDALLPVGINVKINLSGVASFQFRQANAEDITSGSNSYYESASAEAGDVNTLQFDYAFCDAGYVLTAMRLKIRDANWPYNGTVVSDVQIRCTELVANP